MRYVVAPFAGYKTKGVQLIQRIAIYCRVSENDQNCERQERDLLAYASRAGFEVVGMFKETASGSKDNRRERKKVLALAQDRRIDAVLVTKLTRWGRSTLDLIRTLQDLQSWGVSVIAQTGMQYDMTTAHGKLIASVMASLAEFELDVMKERTRSGLAAARARGQVLGRQVGDRPKSNRLGPKVLKLVEGGRSYRAIGRDLGLNPATVMAIVKRKRAADALAV